MKAFHWFQGASVVALVERLTAADPATARLEVHQKGKRLTFVVVDTRPRTLDDPEDPPPPPPPPINDSHVCPPSCP